MAGKGREDVNGRAVVHSCYQSFLLQVELILRIWRTGPEHFRSRGEGRRGPRNWAQRSLVSCGNISLVGILSWTPRGLVVGQRVCCGCALDMLGCRYGGWVGVVCGGWIGRGAQWGVWGRHHEGVYHLHPAPACPAPLPCLRRFCRPELPRRRRSPCQRAVLKLLALPVYLRSAMGNLCAGGSGPPEPRTTANSFYELQAKDLDGNIVDFDQFKGKVLLQGSSPLPSSVPRSMAPSPLGPCSVTQHKVVLVAWWPRPGVWWLCRWSWWPTPRPSEAVSGRWLAAGVPEGCTGTAPLHGLKHAAAVPGTHHDCRWPAPCHCRCCRRWVAAAAVSGCCCRRHHCAWHLPPSQEHHHSFAGYRDAHMRDFRHLADEYGEAGLVILAFPCNQARPVGWGGVG